MKTNLLRLFLFISFIVFGAQLHAQCPVPNNNFQKFGEFDLTPSGVGDTMTSTTTWGGDFHRVQVDSGKTYWISMCETQYFADSAYYIGAPGIYYDPIITLYHDTQSVAGAFNQLSGPIVGFNDDYCGVLPQIIYTATFTGNLAVAVDPAVDCDSFAIDSAIVQVTEILIGISGNISVNNHVSCNGLSDGSATVGVTGNIGPISYLWSTGGTTNSITGLTAGTYSVIVSDSAGNADTVYTAITEPPTLVSSGVVDNNVSCSGLSDGGATASATGGTAAYTYLWSNGATTASTTGAVAGTYSVTVTDANGCTDSSSVIVTEPANLVSSATVSSNASCNSCSDGGATASATGGTTTYNYQWNTGGTTASITNLPVGTYSVTITDANGCTDSASTVINSGPQLSTVVNNNVSCNGLTDGEAMASATGGTSPYTYAWSNGATSATMSSVAAGNYSVTVTDNGGLTSTSSVTITEPAVLVAATVVDSNISCNGFSDGGATAAATGGTSAYTYAWNNGATNASITGVVATTYSVTITDANGCTDSASVTITEPATMVPVTLVNNHVSCNGLSDGDVTASGTYGTSPYTYAWSNGTTANIAHDVPAGTYTVTITDANGCSDTASAVVTEPAVFISTAVVDSNISCNGLTDGGATASATGGTTAYTYTWSNGATIASITGIAVGTYSVTVTDANGCTDSSSINITQPTTLTAASVVDSNVTCNGFSNGGSTVSATGGTTPYSYNWSNTASTASITGVVANTYSVTVTDANGCTSTSSATITEPAALVAASVADSNATCNGLSNGGATASATGGTGAYSYMWNNAATTASITGVIAGTYSVTVTDANGCTDSTSVIITEPAALVASTVVDNNVSCNGLADGAATASATGGTGTYTYTWSTGATTATVTGLAAGTYSVTIVDANGCSANTSITITEPAALVVTTTVVSNVSCNGVCDGEISANITGGSAPYSYIWSNGSAVNPITNLCAGTYTVTVTDANGCTATSTAIVTEPTVLVVSTTLDANVSCNGLADGAATAIATGGTPSHTFLWNTGAATASVTGLAAGTYTVTVTDNNGCTATAALVITEPALLVASTVVDSNVTCFGGADGGVTASATGGTTAYVYAWNTGAATASITGLMAGTYTVTITDANGCTDTSSAMVTEPPLLSVDLGNDTSVCFGGSLTLDPGAGFASYLWQDNSTNQTYNVDTSTPGVADYSVTVTNSNGCIGFDTINVTVFQATGVAISGANDLCAYEIDTLIASSGFVSYIWNTNATTSQIIVDANSLSPGSQNYSVTATDSNGCVSDDAVSFNVFNPVVVDLGPDTSIVWVDGGNNTYTLDAGAGFNSYLWSDLTTNQTLDVTLTNMGTISVVVTDGNGCYGADTVFVDFILDIPTLDKASVNIYPNPAADYLNIDMKGFNGQEVQVIITDMGGKHVINNILKVNGNQTSTLDVSNLPTGTYFIQIQAENQKVVKHIVIR
ncbi:T9SS type A sorting domain-containing protein [bacterium SCSIO 12643]|nr:T9SS type A sorting domain-containing protein [bacterium SCSIO 12643]